MPKFTREGDTVATKARRGKGRGGEGMAWVRKEGNLGFALDIRPLRVPLATVENGLECYC
jgi:hypothetical protein